MAIIHPLALTITLLLAPADRADFKQYYSKWSYHPQFKYYWRQYHYKPGAHHYAIYHPSRGKRIYYYSPTTQRYWGYYDVESKGYSLLPEKDCKKSLNEIPADAFPKPSQPLPKIPREDILFEPPTDSVPEPDERPRP